MMPATTIRVTKAGTKQLHESTPADGGNYGEIPIQTAIWSLSRSVDDWLGAVEASANSGVVLVHPECGELTLLDMVLANARDANHHQCDIVRTLRDLDT